MHEANSIRSLVTQKILGIGDPGGGSFAWTRTSRRRRLEVDVAFFLDLPFSLQTIFLVMIFPFKMNKRKIILLILYVLLDRPGQTI